MLLTQLALVSETTRIDSSQLSRVAAALQKQATRDFTPLWGVPATVDAFDKLEDVPVGYWPVIVKDDIGTPGGRRASTWTRTGSRSRSSSTATAGR
ncbi:hypothetical protein GCM10020000_06000 [Streptomyces olivoverticillatus]